MQRIKQKIANAALLSGRTSSDVRLVAVSKTYPADAVIEAMETGQRLFGENRVQEARDKAPLVSDEAEWHLIGSLQKNKAKYIPGLFSMVHSVDSFELAEALSLAMAKAMDSGKRLASPVLDILIQVNLAGEEQKGGVKELEVLGLVNKASTLPHIRIKGLMIIPPYAENPEESRGYYKALRALRESIAAQNIPDVDMSELSMGMSGDYEVAVEEGATLVRVGSAIFGKRDYI
ncbi:MAG: YggS family pyridoxal phosphate-dependent enzyme [bacterium]|nr:YggS family pyridoxal phosphate-dependent enzyme [bacterium]